jgi:hypothetical protein
MVSVVIRFQIHAASYADIVGNACVEQKCEPTRLTGHGVAQFFLEAFQWHGVKRGDAFAFYAGDIRVEGPHPFCSSGGNLGNGRTRTAMYTDSIEQLRRTAGARQVRVRAETALAAFTTPSSGGWIMFGKSPG